ncbi:MAG: DUF5107 domain-containing protein [Anaerolineae bacterium]|nr:DUF5107 domain-containing protein [Anaerolineae bacterium]
MRQTKLWTHLLLTVLLAACTRETPAPTAPPAKPPLTATTTRRLTNEPGLTDEPGLTQTPTVVLSPAAEPRTASPPAAAASPTPLPAPSPTAVQPTPTATPLPSMPVAVPAGQVLIHESTLTLSTYGYEAAFQKTEPDDAVYPYPRLLSEQVTPAEPKDYAAIVLENDYVALTLLPELGGRVYRWVDKATGRHLLYENPVIKPTGWGYRGWWLAAGGIEFAFPVEEHGLNEWRPWSYSISATGSTASVTVSDVEDRTGLTVGATISLDAAHDYVVIEPWVKNNTESEQTFQYWINAMVTLGDNRVSGRTRLIFPTDQVIVHSTGDESLPGAWQPMTWPIYEGRDLGLYKTWQNYLGFFVPQVTEGFVALYDEAADQGMVRAFTPGWPAGTKFFGPGTLPSRLWTDDDSSYIELWSGITPTFADITTLAAGDTVGWAERWYPVHGIGSVTSANAEAAVALLPSESGAEIGCTVTAVTAGTLTLWVQNRAVEAWDIELTPIEAFHTTWTRPEGSEGPLGLTLQDENGQMLIRTGGVP